MLSREAGDMEGKRVGIVRAGSAHNTHVHAYMGDSDGCSARLAQVAQLQTVGSPLDGRTVAGVGIFFQQDDGDSVYVAGRTIRREDDGVETLVLTSGVLSGRTSTRLTSRRLDVLSWPAFAKDLLR